MIYYINTLQMKNYSDSIDETVNYVIGDGLITFYKNGIPTDHIIIPHYEHKRKA
tara:strand:+ start:1840 stop:2001 length:162 start_codon:yes stop_codon:yes gene_type:complete